MADRHDHTLTYACGHTTTIRLVGRWYRLNPDHLRRRKAEAQAQLCPKCNKEGAAMTTPKHTPTVVRQLGCGCAYTSDGKRHWCPDCSDALGGHPDARYHEETLLCVAAPALLEAAKAMVRDCKETPECNLPSCLALRAAIAAAEGRTE